MKKEDLEALKRFEVTTKLAALKLREAGNNNLADRLLFYCGWATGTIYKLEAKK
jgi:hypothetical protein